MTLLLIFLLLLASSPANGNSDQPNPVLASCPPGKTTSGYSLLSDREIGRIGQKPADSLISLEKKGEIAALNFLPANTLTPYVGAGLNKNIPAETALEALANREQGQSYQLGAGVGCSLGNQARIGLDYRYTPAADSALLRTFSSSNDSSQGRYNISLGLEIHF